MPTEKGKDRVSRRKERKSREKEKTQWCRRHKGTLTIVKQPHLITVVFTVFCHGTTDGTPVDKMPHPIND